MKRLRAKLTKRILGILLIMWCSGIFFNGYVGIGEPVHAQAQISTIDTTGAWSGSISTMSLWSILNLILKIIYLILWPLLVIAGLALDNTLVYASIFHLDAPLWKFRNMMKNFANFTLGFMVLFAIIKSILSSSWAWSAKDEKSPLGIIKTTLIAGILIQASRFLMAALIDVSTIATYAVGGLPLSVLKNTPIGNQKILSVNSQINLNKFDVFNKEWDTFKVWYSTTYGGKTITMSPCRIQDSFVIGREFGDVIYKNSGIFQGDPNYEGYEVCVLNSNQLVMRKEDELMLAIAAKTSQDVPNRTTSIWYKAIMNSLSNITWWQTETTFTPFMVNLQATDQEGLKKWNALFEASNSITISDLIKKSKWFVWPLVTMYSSLLNFAQLTDSKTTTIGETSGIFLIKAWVAIALFFPLLALALVLIARIGVLWLYIVASPFIILKASFKDFIKMDKLEEYLSVKGVMGIIFAPVITVAALSISLIFMTALVNGFASSGSSEQIHQTMGTQTLTPIETGNDAISFQWVAQIEFTKLPWGKWEAMDRFSWLMVNFFAIGLMRMIFFAALKANALGKEIGGKVESFGTNVFKTLPIIPYGWGERVGIGGAARALAAAPERWIWALETRYSNKLEEYLHPTETGTGGVLTDKNVKNIFVPGTTTTGITTAMEKLWVEKEKIPEFITSNNSIIYEQVSKMWEGKEKEELKTAIGDVSKNQNWYADMTKAEAATQINTIITANSIKESMSEGDIQTLLNNDKNKPTLKKYFDNTNDPYTTTIWSKKLTITKNTTNSVDMYTPKFEPTNK